MKGWEKIETGWYVHKNGATVQEWRYAKESAKKSGWHAWRAGARNDDFEVFTTMKVACKWALSGRL